MKIADKAKEADDKAKGPKPEKKEEKKGDAKPWEDFKKDELYPKHKEFAPPGSSKKEVPKDDDNYFNSVYKSDYKHPKDGHKPGEDVHGYKYDPKVFPTDSSLSLASLAKARSLAQEKY